jgi:signal transduction histidine kinase/CheY-like chemotaxis protein
MGGEPRTLILVPSPAVESALLELVERLPWAPDRGIALSVVSGPLNQAVSTARESERSTPIGVIALDEPSVLAALTSGADEAVVMPSFDPQGLAAFVDRVETRARIRLESQRAHENLAHTEKLTALGTLVAGVAHEINNPLTAILLTLDFAEARMAPLQELLSELCAQPSCAPSGEQHARMVDFAREGGPHDLRKMVRDLTTAAESIASIVRDLRLFARADNLAPPELVDVPDMLDHAIRLVGREILQTGLIERDYDDDLPAVFVPRGPLMQVVMNVLINATHAIREVERPLHRIRVSARADDEALAIVVSDTGPGIPPELVHRIFDPFYTTKRAELGTGLGLSISRSLMRRMGGELSLESVYGDGATFLCFVPLPSAEALAGQRVPRRSEIRSLERPSVLVVEADTPQLKSYARMLAPTHRMISAQDGQDAIELLEAGANPSVAIVGLASAECREVIDWLASERPELLDHTVFVGDEQGARALHETLGPTDGRVLRKPVRGDDLLAAIRRVASAR